MPFEPPFIPSTKQVLAAILDRRHGKDRRKRRRPLSRRWKYD